MSAKSNTIARRPGTKRTGQAANGVDSTGEVRVLRVGLDHQRPNTALHIRHQLPANAHENVKHLLQTARKSRWPAFDLAAENATLCAVYTPKTSYTPPHICMAESNAFLVQTVRRSWLFGFDLAAGLTVGPSVRSPQTSKHPGRWTTPPNLLPLNGSLAYT